MLHTEVCSWFESFTKGACKVFDRLLVCAQCSAANTMILFAQKRHSWVFTMVDAETDSNEYPLSQVFPGMSKEAAVQKVKQVKAWLQSLPLAKRPLVKVS